MDKERIKETVEESIDEMMCMDECDSMFSSKEAIEYATKIFREKLTNYYS